MPTINGAGSGLDIESLIQASTITRQRQVTVLQNKQALVNAQQGAVASLKAKLAGVKGAAAKITSLRDKLASAGSSSSKVSVSTKAGAQPGSHKLSVQSLAQSSSIAAAGFTDRTSTGVAAGAGTFKVRAGNGAEISVDVSASTTLQGLADAINNAKGDVTATIVNDGSSTNAFRLVLTANTAGADNKVTVVNNGTTLNFATNAYEQPVASKANNGSYTGTITASGTFTGTASKGYTVEIVQGGAEDVARYKVSTDGGVTWDDNAGAGYVAASAATQLGSNATASGLSLAFGTGGTLTAGDRFSFDAWSPVIKEGRDAVVTVDGVVVRSKSNLIQDAIPGLNFNVTEVTTDPVSIFVDKNTDAADKAIGELISAYNDLVGGIRNAQKYDATTKTAGALLGDSAATRIVSEMSALISKPVPGATGAYRTLAELGITADKNGVLSYDKTKLSKALDKDPEAVLQVLEGVSTGSNSALAVSQSPVSVKAGKYDVNITQAAAKGLVQGGAAMNDTLSASEVLSFTFSSDATATTPTNTSFQVTLSSGSNLDQVVNTLNTAFKTQAVGLTAVNQSGVLRVEAGYGADQKVTVVSNRASGANTTRIGTTTLSGTGVDIAGTVGGVSGKGVGAILTALSGDANGLAVKYEGTSLGDAGFVSVVEGIGRSFQDAVQRLGEDKDSPLVARDAALAEQVKSFDKRIAERQRMLEAAERRARAQYSALDATLGRLKLQGDSVTQSLAALSK